MTDIIANMIIIKHLQEETNLGVVEVFNDPWTQLNKSCSDFNVTAQLDIVNVKCDVTFLTEVSINYPQPFHIKLLPALQCPYRFHL